MPWTRTTLFWLRNRPIISALTNGKTNNNYRNEHNATRSAQQQTCPVEQLKPLLDYEPNSRLSTVLPPKKPSPDGTLSSKHILIEWTGTSAVTARALFLDEYQSSATWDSLTYTDIPVKKLLCLMTTMGLIKVRHIITNEEDAHGAGYELGEDI